MRQQSGVSTGWAEVIPRSLSRSSTPQSASLYERGFGLSCNEYERSRWLGGTQRLQEVRLVVVWSNPSPLMPKGELRGF